VCYQRNALANTKGEAAYRLKECHATTNGAQIEIHRAHKKLGAMLENVSTSRVHLVIKVTRFIILTFSAEHAYYHT
jgi:hypothetical protein